MSKTVAKRSPASEAMIEATAGPRALMGGTRAMRQAGKRFLPKFEAEGQEAYEARKDSSWLFNGFRKTVRDMTGRVFDKPVEIAEGAPAQVMEWSENIDLAGNDLSTFARQVFEDGMSGPGISYIMVDAPARPETVTRAQAQAMNLRPYLVHLRAEDVLGWQTRVINNVTTLTQLRILETVKKSDPKDEFTEIEVDQVRVLDRLDNGVQVRVYRKDKADQWKLTEEPTTTGLTEITVAPFYANRAGFFSGEPMLDDLADINIAHWQSQSDQRNILHFARVPILHASGRNEDEPKLAISAGTAVTSSDPQAKLQWVEHSGAAIGAGRQDLKDLEFQMETFGLQLLVAREGAQSATGEALDAKKETSTLAMTADQLQDALEMALMWMAEYGGLGEPSISVTVNKDFGVSMMTAQELGVMLQAVNSGNLSRETFLGEMARRGMVRADLDIDAERDRLSDAPPSLTGEGLTLGGE
ncbi:DUF4055 domain-containing protein [Roseovarius sp.]|uniref:DUF4055 domain-containing protein n=1 Tax=Roseovarius sp. TaxID=1486281 RepID=UPI00356680A9